MRTESLRTLWNNPRDLGRPERARLERDTRGRPDGDARDGGPSYRRASVAGEKAQTYSTVQVVSRAPPSHTSVRVRGLPLIAAASAAEPKLTTKPCLPPLRGP